jgi:hypothetical protein
MEWDPKLNTLRVDEYDSVSITADNGVTFFAAYSVRETSKIDAITNICRTIFTCFVLSLASIFLSKDAQDLVLDPLERMIEKVKLMA